MKNEKKRLEFENRKSEMMNTMRKKGQLKSIEILRVLV